MFKLQSAVVIAGMALGVFSAAARADVTCSVSDYRGTYGYFSTGNLLQLPPQGAALVGPFAQAGTLTSDGAGNLTLETTASYNGIILPGNTTATYTITPDCQITFNVFLPFPLNANSVFKGVFSNNVRQTSLQIVDPPGSVLPAQQNKQDIRFCGISDFQGAYQIDVGGAIVSPASRAGLFRRIGRILADGNGSFTATSWASYNGLPVQEDFSGTYDVNSKCFVSLNFTLKSEKMLITGPLTGRGESASVIVAAPGWAVAGQLRAQQ